MMTVLLFFQKIMDCNPLDPFTVHGWSKYELLRTVQVLFAFYVAQDMLPVICKDYRHSTLIFPLIIQETSVEMYPENVYQFLKL